MQQIGKLKINPSEFQSLQSHASVGFECLDRELYDPERCYDLLQQAGVKYARVQTGWNRCETEKGVYNFEWLDDIVDNLLQRGIQPWFNVGFGNILYMPNSKTPSAVGQVPICYGAEVMQVWKNYVAALAKHYAGRITHYEIWNEPDISDFWAPGSSNPEEYAQLINETGAVILKENANAKIGACMSDAFASEFLHFKDYLFKLAKKVQKLDFFSYHRYNSRADVDLLQNVSYMRKIFAFNGLPEVEIWGGECGYASYLPKGHIILNEKPSSEQQQAVSLLRYFVTDAAAGCRLTSFFMVVDLIQKVYQTARQNNTNPARSGILNGLSYTPKMAYTALANISNILNGEFTISNRFIALCTRYTKPYVNMPQQPFCAAFEKNGKPFYAYYYPTYIEDECGLFKTPVAVHLQNLYPGDALHNPVAVDSLTGKVYKPDLKTDYDGLTVLEGLPVAEYPIFILEQEELEIER